MAQGTISYKLTDIHFNLVDFGTQVAVTASISKYIVDDNNNPVGISAYSAQLQVALVTLASLTMAQIKAQAILFLQNQYPALYGQNIG